MKTSKKQKKKRKKRQFKRRWQRPNLSEADLWRGGEPLRHKTDVNVRKMTIWCRWSSQTMQSRLFLYSQGKDIDSNHWIETAFLWRLNTGSTEGRRYVAQPQ